MEFVYSNYTPFCYNVHFSKIIMANKTYQTRNQESLDKFGLSLYQRRIESAERRAVEKGAVITRSEARGHAPYKLTRDERIRAEEARGTSHDNFLKGIQTLANKTNRYSSKEQKDETARMIKQWRKADQERAELEEDEIHIDNPEGEILNGFFNRLDNSGRLSEFYGSGSME